MSRLRSPLALALVLLLVASGSAVAARTINGSLLAQRSVAGTKLKRGTVTATELKSLSITAAKLRPGSVTAAKLATNSVTGAKLATGAVSGDKLAAAVITGDKLAAGIITSDKLAAGAVTATALAAGSIRTEQLSDASVTSAKVADGSLAVTDLAAGTIPAAASGSAGGFTALTLVPAPFATSNAIVLTTGKHVVQYGYRAAMAGQPWSCDYEKRINDGAWVTAAAGAEHTSPQDAHDVQFTETVAATSSYEFRLSCARTTATPVSVGSLDLSVVTVPVR